MIVIAEKMKEAGYTTHQLSRQVGCWDSHIQSYSLQLDEGLILPCATFITITTFTMKQLVNVENTR